MIRSIRLFSSDRLLPGNQLHKPAAIPYNERVSLTQRLKKTKVTEKNYLYVVKRFLGKAKTNDQKRFIWFNRNYKQFAPVFLGQLKPRIKLLTTALEVNQLPPPRLPEIAFAGRSNCGKSTLINELTAKSKYARVSRIPGSTQELHFYTVGKPASLNLVDLPGYGFALANEEKRLQWTEFTLYYLKNRKTLKRVVLLIDSRQGIKNGDREMLSFFGRHKIPWQIILTKCDQTPLGRLCRIKHLVDEEIVKFSGMVAPTMLVSALKRLGLDDVRNCISFLRQDRHVVKGRLNYKINDAIEARRHRLADRRARRAQRALQDSKPSEDEEPDPIGGRQLASRLRNVWEEDDLSVEEVVKVCAEKLEGEAVGSMISVKEEELGEAPSRKKIKLVSDKGGGVMLGKDDLLTREEIDAVGFRKTTKKADKQRGLDIEPKKGISAYTKDLEEGYDRRKRSELIDLISNIDKEKSSSSSSLSSPKGVVLKKFTKEKNFFNITLENPKRIRKGTKKWKLYDKTIRNFRSPKPPKSTEEYLQAKNTKNKKLMQWNDAFRKYCRWRRKYPHLASGQPPVNKFTVKSEYMKVIEKKEKISQVRNAIKAKNEPPGMKFRTPVKPKLQDFFTNKKNNDFHQPKNNSKELIVDWELAKFKRYMRSQDKKKPNQVDINNVKKKSPSQ